MGSEAKYEPSSAPKLSLFSFPSKATEPPGMLTPPIHSTVSIPFSWEEAPGKPRPCTIQSKPNSARCLELPPRLLFTETKVASMPSPTTVLDGPYVGRSLSSTISFGGKGGSFRSPESLGKRENKERIVFGSSRWGTTFMNKEFAKRGFEFSSSVVDSGHRAAGGGGVGVGGGGVGVGSDGGVGTGGRTKVRITRVSRGSFLSLSNSSRSHFWAGIYDSVKQAVPWRRRQEKIRKVG